MALVRGSRTTLAVGKECPYYNKGFTSGRVAWRGNVVSRIRGPYGEWYDRVEMKTAADADAESAAFDARMAECADCGRAPHGQKNLRTCWGDSAYQKCPKNRQGAYDLVQASVSKDGDQAKAHAVYLKLLADGFTGRVACSKAIPAIPEPPLWPAQEGNTHAGGAVTYDGCVSMCKRKGYGCLTNPRVGANQMISCAQACHMRTVLAQTAQQCEKHCARNGQSGCSLRVAGGHTYSMCSRCADHITFRGDGTKCAFGVCGQQECRDGCRFGGTAATAAAAAASKDWSGAALTAMYTQCVVLSTPKMGTARAVAMCKQRTAAVSKKRGAGGHKGGKGGAGKALGAFNCRTREVWSEAKKKWCYGKHAAHSGKGGAVAKAKAVATSGEALCEGHGYGKDACAKVGCCQFAECPVAATPLNWRALPAAKSPGGECHSNVGGGACVKRSFASHIEDGSWCKGWVEEGREGWFRKDKAAATAANAEAVVHEAAATDVAAWTQVDVDVQQYDAGGDASEGAKFFDCLETTADEWEAEAEAKAKATRSATPVAGPRPVDERERDRAPPFATSSTFTTPRTTSDLFEYCADASNWPVDETYATTFVLGLCAGAGVMALIAVAAAIAAVRSRAHGNGTVPMTGGFAGGDGDVPAAVVVVLSHSVVKGGAKTAEKGAVNGVEGANVIQATDIVIGRRVDCPEVAV